MQFLENLGCCPGLGLGRKRGQAAAHPDQVLAIRRQLGRQLACCGVDLWPEVNRLAPFTIRLLLSDIKIEVAERVGSPAGG